MLLENPLLRELNSAVQRQFEERTLESGLRTALAVLNLLGCNPEKNVEDIQLTKLQLPNAERYDHWFQPHPYFKSNRSCFELVDLDTIPVQAKFYWLQKKSKLAISGGVHFSPNWEDSEFTRAEGYKVGIDFFLSAKADSLLIVLSDRGKLRIVELNERLRTTQVEIFIKWAQLNQASTPEILHAALWRTFQLQAVNEKFYIGIANAFTELVQHLNSSNSGITEADSKQFVNRLIGRLLFCWFLKKRGLLDKQQGYFEIDELNSTDYYHVRLEPLFFLTLNTPLKERAGVLSNFLEKSTNIHSKKIKQIIGIDLKTPYLNGGLFDIHENDYFNTSILDFPSGYFVRLYEHFDSYNFTTDESSPEYEQVAIDPEMLGKVFESLLATQVDATGEQARQAIGAFYTPRNIVTYMCTEAIRTALLTKLKSSPKSITAVNALLDTTDAQWAMAGTNSKRDAIKGQQKEILGVLKNIKIFDPACGSGAFPMGMLQLLVKLHQRLTSQGETYEVKMHYLERSLFGTDIEPMAIEISKLRAWLSLIVDQEETHSVDALPNLDFHFICCNSLVRLKEEDGNTLSFFDEPREEMAEIKTQYFYSTSPKEKKQLQSKYENFIKLKTDVVSDRVKQLLSYHPFSSDKPAEFFDKYEMFGMNEGFDIVIGNPPYVRQERIKYKDSLTDYSLFTSTADLYTYFFELAFVNLKPSGVLSFITSSKYGRALYGEGLRRLLSTEKEINYLVDFGDEHIFAAITNTWVIQLSSKRPDADNRFKLFKSIEALPNLIPQAKLTSEPWTFNNEATELVKNKIKQVGPLLKNSSYRILYGIKTGLNDAFVIDEQIKDELVASDTKNAEILMPLLRGRDIARYETKPIVSWIIATKNEFKVPQWYPIVAEYLEMRDKELEGKVRKRGDQGDHWMNLRDCAYYDLMESEKIIWLELTDRNKFTYTNRGEYILAGAWMISGPNLKALLGVLNSTLVNFYFQFISNSSGMGTTQWKKFAVENIPIPDFKKIPKSLFTQLVTLVDKRLSLRMAESTFECEELEKEIDSLVYQIYGLSSEEIAIIEADQVLSS
jgi:type I restriction-modification system DNA methylase subunit